MTLSDPLVEMKGVVKAFGGFEAIRAVTLSLRRAEVVALLGHNGAGKTVLVRMIGALAWPTSGSVLVGGHDTRRHPVEVRRLTGTCLDDPLLWPDLTGYQTLRLVADAYEVDWDLARRRTGEVLDCLDFRLPDDTLVGQYSLGMKRKLGLAVSLVADAPVLIWDEPEIGLDAVSRVGFRELVARLRDRGHLVLLTTHAIELADTLADRIAVLRRGKIVAVDTPARLRTRRGTDDSLEAAFLAILSDKAGDGAATAASGGGRWGR